MSSNATISKQGGRRYRQFRSTASLGARPFSSTGAGAATVLCYGPLIVPAASTYRPGARAADIYRPGAKACEVSG